MNSLIESNLVEIRALMTRYGVVRAHLFGSAADDTMTEKSDVDFLVSFHPELDYTEYGNNYFELIYALQDLLNKDVDLIAEETLKNPFLIRSIDKQKILIL